MAESLSSILASEARLVNEAAEALPHQFNSCTYSLGHIRQAVYLCLSCALPRGICASCSVACHTDHEQIELFPKRHFRCDCPTSTLAHPCTLHNTSEEDNRENAYGQNFTGVFCRCGRPYDANKERETMIQCLACEDWFHESCLNLRERPPSREPTPGPAFDTHDLELSAGDNADAASETSSSGLPPPLITDSEYEAFICSSCVLANPTIRRWAGTKGAKMVTRGARGEPWEILDGVSEEDEVEDNERSLETRFAKSEAISTTVNKRMLEVVSSEKESEESRAKRPRTDVETSTVTNAEIMEGSAATAKPVCLAPRQPTKARTVLESASSVPPNSNPGTGDVFFSDGFRTRWCHCDGCLPPLKTQPYLLEEEETYEPPEDPDSAFSLEDLGMRALQALPRDRAIDGIRAFNEMRDDLFSYLRPFAQEGKTVNEADVRRFFEEKQEALRASRE